MHNRLLPHSIYAVKVSGRSGNTQPDPGRMSGFPQRRRRLRWLKATLIKWHNRSPPDRGPGQVLNLSKGFSVLPNRIGDLRSWFDMLTTNGGGDSRLPFWHSK